MFWAKIAAVVAAALVVTPVRADDAPETGVQLAQGNFADKTAKGLWLVEHFSPKCGHCQQFAPMWENLTHTYDHLKRIAGFHMAQVNCIAQGDLCQDNNIKGYPQLNMYADGKFLGEFASFRTYDILTKYIEDHVYAYTEGRAYKSDEDEKKHMTPPDIYRPNRKGEVVEVDSASLDDLRAKGPVFVKFYAPWCPHCKTLAPIYEELAGEMQGTLNIAAVNCDNHPNLCKAEHIEGYPTMKLFQKGQAEFYEGRPSKGKMRQFVEERIETPANGLVTIKERDFDTILHDDDEFFLYLTTWDTTAEEKAQVEAALEGSPVPIYTSSDPRFYTNLSIANPAPTSVLLSFASHNPKFIGSVSLPAGQQKLEKFIFMNEQPTLMDLTSDAYDSVMKNDKHPLVVVGVIRPGTEGAADRAVMLSTARAWKRGGRAFQQPVWFVNVDAEEWAKWLKKMVSIKVEDAPVAVVIDTDTREYYDITLEGERAGLTGPDIFSLLEGVFQQYLKPKKIESGLEWGARSATLSLMSAGRWSVEHPFSAAIVVVVGVFVFIYILSKCVARERHHGGGYLNEKGGQRLD